MTICKEKLTRKMMYDCHILAGATQKRLSVLLGDE